ncbi:NEDD8-activating enzyme E1 regulatory subunit [Capsicum annuum]|nr:NEDD8-activating enzyme E1 regulatory subunit [Capsicum annuum]
MSSSYSSKAHLLHQEVVECSSKAHLLHQEEVEEVAVLDIKVNPRKLQHWTLLNFFKIDPKYAPGWLASATRSERGSHYFTSSHYAMMIWGEQGQAALEKASICLLNCGSTGSETLKNLVLGGVGSITVVDGSKVEVGDLGNNFMVDESSVGQSKAECVCAFLQELNDAVKAKFIEEHPVELIETNPSFFSQFTLVIATQLVEDSMVKLDRICREANIILIFARSYGLMGLVRISVKEHTVIESKPDHFLDDLRLNDPWPELQRFAETIDLNTTDAVAHKHTPYIIILVKVAEEWANTHDGKLPSTREEKKHFKDLIKSKMIMRDEENYSEAMEASYKVFSPQGIGPNLQKIINDSCTEVDSNSSDFWVLVAALKEFIANEGGGETPLEGSIPDMTSSTELYINLQKTYQAKAEADFRDMEERVKNLLKKISRDPASISKANIKSFCKNARKIAVCRYRLVEDEFNSPAQPELQKYLIDEDHGTLQEANSLKVLPENTAAGLYILLRAADRFAANYNKFPGQFDGEMDEDISRLKTTVVGLLNDLGCNGSTLSEDLIKEMCRYGASELHAVAAFVGGVASQEVIKIAFLMEHVKTKVFHATRDLQEI